MAPIDLHNFAHPEWSDAAAINAALEALRTAHDEPSAHEAYDMFLWAVGNNHSGTFYPVVLAVLPQLEQILSSAGPWSQRATMESLLDLAGTFIPEDGHETHLGRSVRGEVRAFAHSLRPRIVPLSLGSDARARSALDLLELIDDQAT